MASGAPADRRRPGLEAFGHSPGGRLKTAGAHKPSESAWAAFSPFPKFNGHVRGTDPAGAITATVSSPFTVASDVAILGPCQSVLIAGPVAASPHS
jgi:hypothetical protein